MSKQRIYLPGDQIAEVIYVKDKRIIHKLKNVLRLKPEYEIIIFNGQGKEYLYKLEKISSNQIVLQQKKQIKQSSKPVIQIGLAFPLTKEEKIDFILQKGTELGVDFFIPFICQRSLQNLPSNQRYGRWEKIVQEAARQSGRLWLPEIKQVHYWQEVLNLKGSLKLSASLKGKIFVEFIKESKPINKGKVILLIGPEGDFSCQEYEQLGQAGFVFVRIAKNILRTETAAIFLAGLISLNLLEIESES